MPSPIAKVLASFVWSLITLVRRTSGRASTSILTGSSTATLSLLVCSVTLKPLTVQDLWQALSEGSGKDVTGVMNNWVSKMGFPVVSISETDKRGVYQVGKKHTRRLI